MKYTKQIKIPNFGTFKILEKTERIGRNPKTKELSKITPRKVITFRASVALKEKLKFSMNDKKK